MIHQKNGGQVGKTISHYKIFEKIASELRVDAVVEVSAVGLEDS